MQKEEIIKDIVGIDIKVLTYSGRLKIIHFDDFCTNGLTSMLSVETICDPISTKPPYKHLTLDVECYDYNMSIEQAEPH